jgi:hypothetical protein
MARNDAAQHSKADFFTGNTPGSIACNNFALTLGSVGLGVNLRGVAGQRKGAVLFCKKKNQKTFAHKALALGQLVDQ